MRFDLIRLFASRIADAYIEGSGQLERELRSRARTPESEDKAEEAGESKDEAAEPKPAVESAAPAHRRFVPVTL